MKVAVVVSQRLCRVKECSQFIRWHETKPGFGFWANADGDHKNERHLCPFWNDKRSGKSFERERTKDIILQKIIKLESTVEEIRLRIESILPTDTRQ